MRLISNNCIYLGRFFWENNGKKVLLFILVFVLCWFKIWDKNYLEVKLENSFYFKVMNFISIYFSLLFWVKGLFNKGFVNIDNIWFD